MKATNKVVAVGRIAFFIAVLCPLLAGPAAAGIVSTEQVLLSSDRDRVRAFLEREEAKGKLQSLGVTSRTASERVGAMTESEVRAVAAKIDTLPAGGALDKSDWILIILLTILLIVVL